MLLILDPIDGTRGLMYGKRSGWVLSAAAICGDDEIEPTETVVLHRVVAQACAPLK